MFKGMQVITAFSKYLSVIFLKHLSEISKMFCIFSTLRKPQNFHVQIKSRLGMQNCCIHVWMFIQCCLWLQEGTNDVDDANISYNILTWRQAVNNIHVWFMVWPECFRLCHEYCVYWQGRDSCLNFSFENEYVEAVSPWKYLNLCLPITRQGSDKVWDFMRTDLVLLGRCCLLLRRDVPAVCIGSVV